VEVKFIDPFIRAGFTVLSQVVSASPERGQLSLRSGNTFTSQELTAVLGVNGMAEGVALYGMSDVTASKIAAQMLGQDVDEIDELASSALGELANMITGNATTYLEAAGYRCDITPPSLIRGTGVQITTICPALVVPVATQFGKVEINVALIATIGRQ
jgi:chemotaxis protein CheX